MAVDVRLIPVAADRALAVREIGDPDGYPIIDNHGGLVCGSTTETADVPARRLGLRIVAPNRPGIGASDAQPGRDMRNWTQDVAALADRLGVGEFGVYGWSMGGQYALACAAFLGDRVTRAVVVAGAMPLDTPASLATLNPLDRRLTRLADRHPAAARWVFATAGVAARHLPRLTSRMFAGSLSDEDARLVSGLPPHQVSRWLAEALRQPRGMVEEYRAWVRPWGFELSGISVPTTIFRGTTDALICEDAATQMAAAIPGAQFTPVPGTGHLLPLADWALVLEPFTRHM